MAAKPPEPPRNCINNSSNLNLFTNNNNNNTINNNNCNNHNYIQERRDNTNNYEYNRRVDDNQANHHDLNRISVLPTPLKHTCNCSNISIMHLFHEMKQEFPTIPDHIVAQCVNENCHERDNCILVLRRELDLNPIPAQTYPAKVLQRQQQLQQERQQHQKQYCSHPLKPVRTAPPISVAFNSKPSLQAVPKSNYKNCDNSFSRIACPPIVADNNLGNCACTISPTIANRKLDMPDIISTTTTTSANSAVGVCPAHPPSPDVPRVRPTTLDLNQTQQQQQLRQQLNVQLQQHLNHRKLAKPLRKAPLPPLPPKPTHITSQALFSKETTAVDLANRNGCNSSLSSLSLSINNNNNSNNSIPSSPTTTPAPTVRPNTSTPTSHLPQTPFFKSPTRHRSTISVQPKPPYSRDYLPTLPSPSSSTGAGSNQKSFTSVNLTLRQPNTSGAQSTIDISAGPGLSGGSGSGLTYSSTSYDARRRCQKNFHITVSDGGGVFSASRIQSGNIHNSVHDRHDQSPIMQRRQQQQQKQRFSNFKRSREQKHCVRINDTEVTNFPQEIDAFDENLQRQIARRDKLISALHDNEKRLHQVEEEINLLTEPISPGASERLENEIKKLRCDCEILLNELENSKRYVHSIENNQHSSEMPNTSESPQTIQKSFPHQRPPRHSPVIRQSTDFVQHHISNSAPTSLMNSPNQQMSSLHPTPNQQHHQQHHQQQQQQQLFQQSTDEEEGDVTDSNTDGGEDDLDNDGGLEMWPCSMCTFRNHPQLNICECCENVRILPGTLRIVPSSVPRQTTQTALTRSLLLDQLPSSSLSPSESLASILTRANDTDQTLTQMSETTIATSNNNPTITITKPLVTATLAATAAIIPQTSISNTANILETDAQLNQKQQQQLALHT